MSATQRARTAVDGADATLAAIRAARDEARAVRDAAEAAEAVAWLDERHREWERSQAELAEVPAGLNPYLLAAVDEVWGRAHAGGFPRGLLLQLRRAMASTREDYVLAPPPAQDEVTTFVERSTGVPVEPWQTAAVVNWWTDERAR